MARANRPGDQINNSPIIIITPPAPPPLLPAEPQKPSPWVKLTASLTVVTLAVVVTLFVVVLSGDSARAEVVGAFIRGLLPTP